MTKNIQKPFKCSDCEKYYKTKGSRTRHYNAIHLMIGNHCVLCPNRWFKRKYRLKMHLEEHMKNHDNPEIFRVNEQYNRLFPVCKIFPQRPNLKKNEHQKESIKCETTLIFTVTIPSTNVVDEAAKILTSFCTS